MKYFRSSAWSNAESEVQCRNYGNRRTHRQRADSSELHKQESHWCGLIHIFANFFECHAILAKKGRQDTGSVAFPIFVAGQHPPDQRPGAVPAAPGARGLQLRDLLDAAAPARVRTPAGPLADATLSVLPLTSVCLRREKAPQEVPGQVGLARASRTCLDRFKWFSSSRK